jgi:hypothetical protein
VITLKTLAAATAQQVFDQVATHLQTQGKVSQGAGGCVYRGPEGAMCAAGCLMADDEYQDAWENHTWVSLRFGGFVPDVHESLIAGLQYVHDDYDPTNWPDALRQIAHEFNLSSAVVVG